MTYREQTTREIANLIGVDWIPGQVTVALEEELGYRVWFWFTGMQADAFEEWWRGLESVMPYFFDPTKPTDGAAKLPGTLVVCDGDSESHNRWRFFQAVADYKCEMHTDSDSYLSKTVTIHHKGFCKEQGDSDE